MRRPHPASPAPSTVIVAPPQRGSMFRDMAATAGGVAVGSAIGHVAGHAITGLFSGRKQEAVEEALPSNYDFSSEPTGPCAYEIKQFLNCASNRENLEECQAFNEALQRCKYNNRIA